MRIVARLLAPLLAAGASVVSGAADAEAATVPHVLISGAVGSARQVVLVASSEAAATYAQVSLWSQGSDGTWRQARSPVTARVGRNGMTGSKREGDGKTPVGVYPVGVSFGWYSNPGTKLTWRVADSNSRWVDDSDSDYYNRWMQAPANGRWDSAERLRITPYTYAIEIGYNRVATPGKGSAIFLHLPVSGATAGCVATDRTTLLTTLRWLNPAAHPVFVIGTRWWIANH